METSAYTQPLAAVACQEPDWAGKFRKMGLDRYYLRSTPATEQQMQHLRERFGDRLDRLRFNGSVSCNVSLPANVRELQDQRPHRVRNYLDGTGEWACGPTELWRTLRRTGLPPDRILVVSGRAGTADHHSGFARVATDDPGAVPNYSDNDPFPDVPAAANHCIAFLEIYPDGTALVLDTDWSREGIGAMDAMRAYCQATGKRPDELDGDELRRLDCLPHMFRNISVQEFADKYISHSSAFTRFYVPPWATH